MIDATEELFKLLEQNHNVTQNTSSLIRVFLTRATELKASAQCDKYYLNSYYKKIHTHNIFTV